MDSDQVTSGPSPGVPWPGIGERSSGPDPPLLLVPSPSDQLLASPPQSREKATEVGDHQASGGPGAGLVVFWFGRSCVP